MVDFLDIHVHCRGHSEREAITDVLRLFCGSCEEIDPSYYRAQWIANVRHTIASIDAFLAANSNQCLSLKLFCCALCPDQQGRRMFTL